MIVRLKPKDRPFIAKEVVFRLELVDQLHHLSIWVRQILPEDEIFGIRTEPDMNDEVTTIFRDIATKPPFFFIRTLVNKDIFSLGRS